MGRKKYAELYSQEHARELHEANHPYSAVLLLDEVRHRMSTFGYTLLTPQREELWLYSMIFFDVPYPRTTSSSRFEVNRNRPGSMGTWKLRVSLDRTPVRDLSGYAPESWDDPPFPLPSFGDYGRLYRPHHFDPLAFQISGT